MNSPTKTSTAAPVDEANGHGAERPARSAVGRRPDAEHVPWSRCPSCGALVYGKRLNDNLKVCPECRYHLRLSVDERLHWLLDPGSLAVFGDDLLADDPLGFVDSKAYPDRLAAARARAGRADAAVAGTATIDGHRLVVVALDFQFMGGSVGGVVGELVVRACERSLADRSPLLLISASGGARMQEGALSLMQLAKTAQEIARLHEAGLLVINLNTDPTFGGATASFSTLGDIVLSEPGALIGFAGPQVIRQTIRQDLPPGFQTAEFLHEHGILDLVVARENLRGVLSRLLRLHTVPDAARRTGSGGPTPPAAGGGAEGAHAGSGAEGAGGARLVAGPVVTSPAELVRHEPREMVSRARDTARPTTLDYLSHTFDEFTELHGDGATGDDAAVVGGIGRIDGRAVVFIGHQRDTTPRSWSAATSGCRARRGTARRCG